MRDDQAGPGAADGARAILERAERAATLADAAAVRGPSAMPTLGGPPGGVPPVPPRCRVTMLACDRAVAAASDAIVDTLGGCSRDAYYFLNSRSDVQALRFLIATALGEWLRTQQIDVD